MPSATSAPATLGDSIGGIYSKIVAIALFATMDAMVKALGERYPTLQLMLCRSLIGALPVVWLMHAAGGWTTLRTRQPLLQTGRVILAFITTFGFFYLFPLMPLAGWIAAVHIAQWAVQWGTSNKVVQFIGTTAASLGFFALGYWRSRGIRAPRQSSALLG